jgi:hypothetical protein
MSKSVAEALPFDKRSVTDFWRKSIKIEMFYVMPALKFRDDDKVSIVYNKITSVNLCVIACAYHSLWQP